MHPLEPVGPLRSLGGSAPLPLVERARSSPSGSMDLLLRFSTRSGRRGASGFGIAACGRNEPVPCLALGGPPHPMTSSTGLMRVMSSCLLQTSAIGIHVIRSRGAATPKLMNDPLTRDSRHDREQWTTAPPPPRCPCTTSRSCATCSVRAPQSDPLACNTRRTRSHAVAFVRPHRSFMAGASECCAH